LAGVQAPLEQVCPQAPQFEASVPRFLHEVALGPVLQHTEAEVEPEVQCLWRQLGSAQSVRPLLLLSMPSEQFVSHDPAQSGSLQSVVPSQSLSLPSPQMVSVAGTGNTP
jgi:hypothetical protein